MCDSPRVEFWGFLYEVPSAVRFLLCLALTVGISLALLRILYPRQITMSAKGQQAFEENPGLPRPNDAIGRVTPLTVVAFVFLTGIAVSQFWTNARLATEATSSELTSYSRADAYAAEIPADRGGTQISAALDAYRTSVVDVQWPLLQRAEAQAAYEVQAVAAKEVHDAVAAAAASGAADEGVWDSLVTATDDMLLFGTDRIDSVPQSNAIMLVLLVIMLGITNLVALALASTSYRGLSMLLVGIAAGLVGLLMFVAVEMSNPYLLIEAWPSTSTP